MDGGGRRNASRHIDKYGTGKWMDIKEFPLFADQLFYRTNIDLKDIWHNLNNKEKSMTQKLNSASISHVNSSRVVKNELSTNSSSNMSYDSRIDDAIVLETT